MVWHKDPLKKYKVKRRPMVASLLEAAQKAEAEGKDGDAVIAEMQKRAPASPFGVVAPSRTRIDRANPERRASER